MFPYATGSMRGPLVIHKVLILSVNYTGKILRFFCKISVMLYFQSTPEAEKYVIISNPDRFAEISRAGKLLN